MLQRINEAQATLEAVGAEAELFNDMSVVAQLVSKLSGLHQDRWHQDKTLTPFWNDQRRPGGARKTGGCRCLGTTDTSGTEPVQTTSEHPPWAEIRACGKGGHKTDTSAEGESKGLP